VVREKLTVRLDRSQCVGVGPIALFLQLRNAQARLVRELAVGVLLEKTRIGFACIGGFRRTPILLLAAAAG
jgi:hypothetical protein